MSTASELARSGPLRAAADLLPGSRHVLRLGRARARSDAGGQAGRRRRPAGQPRRGDRRQLRGAPAGREVGHVADRGGQAGARRDLPADPRRHLRHVRRARPRDRPALLARPCWSPASTRCSSTSRAASGCTAAPATRAATSPSSARCSSSPARSTASWGCPPAPGIATSKVDGEGGVQPGQAARRDAGPRRASSARCWRRCRCDRSRASVRSPRASCTRPATRRWAPSPTRRSRSCARSSAPGRRRSSAACRARARARSAASARRSRSTIPRARPSAASPTSAPSARTCPIRPSIESVLCGLCERVCWRARKRRIKARTVTLKLRYADFHTLTRSRTLAPTSSELELYPIVKEMLGGGAHASAAGAPARRAALEPGRLRAALAVRPPRKGRRRRRPASASATASRWSRWPRSWAARARRWSGRRSVGRGG